MTINDFLLSRITTVVLNILQCALYAFALIGPSTGGTDRPVLSYFVPFVAPTLTLIFLLSNSPGPVLAAITVTINLIAVLIGFLLLYMLSDVLTPLLVLGTGFSGMLIPAISMLAVAMRWPKQRRSPSDTI
jgi:uncharacterized membrane protein